jgi:hypothetical protein
MPPMLAGAMVRAMTSTAATPVLSCMDAPAASKMLERMSEQHSATLVASLPVHVQARLRGDPEPTEEAAASASAEERASVILATREERPRTASGAAASVPTLGLCERSGVEELTLAAAVAPSARSHQLPVARESWMEPSEEALAAGATVGFFSPTSGEDVRAVGRRNCHGDEARAEGGSARDAEAMKAAMKAGSALVTADTLGFDTTQRARDMPHAQRDEDSAVSSPSRGDGGGVWASKSIKTNDEFINLHGIREGERGGGVAELKLRASGGDDSPEFDAVHRSFQVGV